VETARIPPNRVKVRVDRRGEEVMGQVPDVKY